MISLTPEQQVFASLIKFKDDKYYSDHPYILSHSILEDFHRCERKFHINRLLEGSYEKKTQSFHVRGSAYGVGIQVYLLTGDMDKALFATWLAYHPEVEDLERRPF